MRRRNLIVSAVVVGAIVAVLPLMLAFFLSYKLTIAGEKRKLDELADRGLRNATAILMQASDTLTEFSLLAVAPCSEEHISRMRIATLNTRSVDKIVYFSHGLCRCTSWGIVSGRETRQPPDVQLVNGMGMRQVTHPSGVGSTRMMEVSHSNHAVLVAASRFLPMNAVGTTRVAAFTAKGTLIAAQPDMDVVLASALAKGAAVVEGMRTPLVSIASGDDIVVVASMSRPSAQMLAVQLLWYWFPTGIIGSFLLVYGVRRLLLTRLSVYGELKAAIDRSELSVRYQPMFDLATGRCVGAEALLRWDSRESGRISPNVFIPLAEKHGLIGRITLQMLELVVQDMADMLALNRDMHVSVNLSVDDMKDGKLLKTLRRIVRTHNIRACQIWLEVTERSLWDVESTATFLTAVRKFGHVVTIDDFGTGYSGLLALQELPIDVLKIDKSFLKNIGKVHETQAVVPHIIRMAKALNLRIVAEGVESIEQVQYLREQGVDWGQGWWYAKAMPAGEFKMFAVQRAGTPPAGAGGVRLI